MSAVTFPVADFKSILVYILPGMILSCHLSGFPRGYTAPMVQVTVPAAQSFSTTPVLSLSRVSMVPVDLLISIVTVFSGPAMSSISLAVLASTSPVLMVPASDKFCTKVRGQDIAKGNEENFKCFLFYLYLS